MKKVLPFGIVAEIHENDASAVIFFRFLYWLACGHVFAVFIYALNAMIKYGGEWTGSTIASTVFFAIFECFVVTSYIASAIGVALVRPFLHADPSDEKKTD
jgi:hypothetical protein